MKNRSFIIQQKKRTLVLKEKLSVKEFKRKLIATIVK